MELYDFTQTLAELDGGVFSGKLSRAVRDVAVGVVQQNKKGKVVIELTMERQGNSSQVLLAHKLKYEKPTARGKAGEEDTTETPLYVSSKGISVMPDTQTDMFKQKED